jgi:hypothetical protein
MPWVHSLQSWDFSQILPHYHQNFPFFSDSLYADRVKLFAEESKLFTLAVFLLVVVRKTASWGMQTFRE